MWVVSVRCRAGRFGARCPGIPDVVAGLSAPWGMRLGRADRDGTASDIVAAREASGLDVVLKVVAMGGSSSAFHRSAEAA